MAYDGIRRYVVKRTVPSIVRAWGAGDKHPIDHLSTSQELLSLDIRDAIS
jgi:hypothetical protein